MNGKFPIVLLSVVLASSNTLGDDFRIWTDSTGRFTVEAEFVQLGRTELTLKTRLGEVVRIDISKLSKSDQNEAYKIRADIGRFELHCEKSSTRIYESLLRSTNPEKLARLQGSRYSSELKKVLFDSKTHNFEKAVLQARYRMLLRIAMADVTPLGSFQTNFFALTNTEVCNHILAAQIECFPSFTLEHAKQILDVVDEARQGKAAAFYRMSEIYSDSDWINSLWWCYQAGLAGHPQAITVVGLNYLIGDELIRDHELAFQWLTRGHDANQVLATAYLAKCYYSGLGTGKDMARALQLAKLVELSGNADAIAEIASLTGK